MSSEGKESAKSYDAKYIETSCVLKHNVDELLVGVTKQILLRKKESSMGSNSRAGTQSRVKIILIQYHWLLIDIFIRIESMGATPPWEPWWELEQCWWICSDTRDPQKISRVMTYMCFKEGKITQKWTWTESQHN